jgi:hypothetical protein
MVVLFADKSVHNISSQKYENEANGYLQYLQIDLMCGNQMHGQT